MAEDTRVHVDVALERSGGTICGSLDDGAGPVVEFSGWLELMSALDTVREQAMSAIQGPDHRSEGC